MSNIFNIKLRDIISAVVSAVIVALLGYLNSLTRVVDINFHQVFNIAILTGVTSLLKSFVTTDTGKFVGAIKIK